MDVTETPIRELIRKTLDQLSPAERRVAEVVDRDPEAVAFGTVAELARRAGTSGPSVVRLADRLGLAGFTELQARVRQELSERLRPAVERIRSETAAPVLARVLEAELENVRQSLGAANGAAFARAVDLLADPGRKLFVLPSEQSSAVGRLLADELSLLRDGVQLLRGSPFAIATRLAALAAGDVLVALDYRRHERWLLEATQLAHARGARRIAITNTALSPLCAGAECALRVSAAAAGPFDSHVGMLALAGALVAGVAERHRARVARRIDALEALWVESGVLAPDR